MEKPRLKRDWVGRYVSLRENLRNNGGYEFKAGSVMKVVKNRGGLELVDAVVCPHCNNHRYRRVSKVEEFQVRLLPEDYEPPAVVKHANSCLIAAAPELLAVAEAAASEIQWLLSELNDIDAINGDDREAVVSVLGDLRSIIVKAQGGAG